MKLYDYQKRVAGLVRDGRSIILQAPTGAGKTRASLWPFLQAWAAGRTDVPKKCVYSVPMRVLANQFTEETSHLVYKEMLIEKPPKVEIQTGERPKDPEFKADLTFATIDQVLSSWLLHPYSLSGRQGNLNAGAFVGSYLVFDEFHLFNPDSTLPTTLHLLQTLRAISPFILMTATFSQAMLEELAAVLGAEPFLLTPADLAEIPAQRKERTFALSDVPLLQEGVAQIDPVLEQHQAQPEPYRRSLVVFNQVERAQRFYQALQQHAPAGVQVRLLHSRFRREDRQRIEEEIRREFGKDKGQYQFPSLILVATQVIEVGLDMTCAALHTELAPAAAVLQRAGRCARYQGEAGHVTVYPVEKYAPYSEKLARAQCDLTWEWLGQNQGRHLAFADEQELVNHAHTPADRLILDGLQAGRFEQAEQVQALWRGEGGRAEAGRLVRDVTNQSILIHSDPEQFRHNPFAAELFSLHPGTLQGKFEGWKEQAADDFEADALPWVAKRLEEDQDEGAAQGNRPPRYGWKKVNRKEELLGAPLVVIHPALVGYAPDLGLTLYPGQPYQSPVPPAVERGPMQKRYRLETYHRHIEWVQQAFQEGPLPSLQAAAHRLEQSQGWRPGLVTDVAHLVIWLHDLGKLNEPWQRWVHRWQQDVGAPTTELLAHTDYQGDDPTHRDLERKLGRRPNHAVEGALAAVPYLHALLPDYKHPLFRAAFTAIARHHAPFSREAKDYSLVGEWEQEVEASGRLLPATLRSCLNHVQVKPTLKITPANAMTARMASSVSVGKSARMSSTQAPSARLARIVRTGTRVPRTTGSPPQIRGSRTTSS